MLARLRPLPPLLLFGALPALLVAQRFGVDPHHLVDFRNLWHAGRDVLAGRSPYHPAPGGRPLTSDCLLSGPDCYVYPPLAAVVFSPLAALPFAAAGALYFALSVGAVALALGLVGVRDWRCYAIAIASAPALSAFEGGTLTPFLALGLAVAWRYRDRRLVAGGAVAAVVAAKVFLWPLLLWLVATRRARAAAAAAALGAAATLAAWAAVGFAGFRSYPSLLRATSDAWGPQAYALHAIGVPSAAAWTLGAAVLALGLRGTDERALAAAVGASLLLSPIVWLHYFTLILVPLAIARPRLAWSWALPVAFLPLPGMAGGHAAVVLLGLALAAATLVQPPRRPAPRASVAGAAP